MDCNWFKKILRKPFFFLDVKFKKPGQPKILSKHLSPFQASFPIFPSKMQPEPNARLLKPSFSWNPWCPPLFHDLGLEMEAKKKSGLLLLFERKKERPTFSSREVLQSLQKTKTSKLWMHPKKMLLIWGKWQKPLSWTKEEKTSRPIGFLYKKEDRTEEAKQRASRLETAKPKWSF